MSGQIALHGLDFYTPAAGVPSAFDTQLFISYMPRRTAKMIFKMVRIRIHSHIMTDNGLIAL